MGYATTTTTTDNIKNNDGNGFVSSYKNRMVTVTIYEVTFQNYTRDESVYLYLTGDRVI